MNEDIKIDYDFTGLAPKQDRAAQDRSAQAVQEQKPKKKVKRYIVIIDKTEKNV